MGLFECKTQRGSSTGINEQIVYYYDEERTSHSMINIRGAYHKNCLYENISVVVST